MLDSPRVSVVIRSIGEEKYLRVLLRLLRKQTIRDIETILVVDYSHAETLDVVNRLPADKIIPLAHDEFNHAYSTNLGVSASRGKFVAFTNGHSLPISDRWLEAAARHFSDARIAGVTGMYMPLPEASLVEKIYFTPTLVNLYRRSWVRKLLRASGHYLFSTTNCMIRRDLWEAYAFDESLPECEDYDWGLEMQARGYLTLVDPDFSVFHSHGDSAGRFLRKQIEWGRLTKRVARRVRPRSSVTRLRQRSVKTNFKN